MKVQNMAIIFIIVIIPILMLLGYYLSLQEDTLEMQAEYNAKLSSAVKEGIKAYEINTVNWRAIKGETRRNVNASVNTFLTSLANNIGVSGTAKEYMTNYIPAVAMTMYSGYYIYSPSYVPKTIENDKGVQLYYNKTTREVTTSDTAVDPTTNAVILNDLIYEPAAGVSPSTGVYKYTDDEGREKQKSYRFTTDATKAAKTYKHSLSNEIAYSGNYKKGSLDVTINYTLDNRIYVYGKNGTEDINEQGCLVYFNRVQSNLPKITLRDNAKKEEDIIVNTRVDKTVYNGSNINAEILTEQVLYKPDSSSEPMLETFKYIYDITNEKLYYDENKQSFFTIAEDSKERRYLDEAASIKAGDNGCRYKSVSVLTSDKTFKKLYQALNGRDKGKWFISLKDHTDMISEIGPDKEVIDTDIETNILDYGLSAIYCDYSAISYYVEAYAFTNWIGDPSRLGGTVTQSKVIFDDSTNTYKTVTENISNLFVITEANDIEKKESLIAQHKKQVMIDTINSNLNLSISNYSRNSEHEFKLPVLTDEDWDTVFKNISMIAFFQGVPIGLKMYNNYAIATSNLNRDYVDPDELYFTTTSNTYHRPYCTKEKLDAIKIDYKGYRSVEYSLRTYEKDNKSIYYYQHTEQPVSNNHSELACYYCIVNKANYTRTIDIPTSTLTPEQKDVRNIQAKAYRETLARERYYQHEALVADFKVSVIYDANLSRDPYVVQSVRNVDPNIYLHEKGTSHRVISASPTVTSYSDVNWALVFDSWNTKADGTGTKYMAGSTLFNLQEDITLYAQWNFDLSRLNWWKDYYWTSSEPKEELFNPANYTYRPGLCMMYKHMIGDGSVSLIDIKEDSIYIVGNSTKLGRGACWSLLPNRVVNHDTGLADRKIIDVEEYSFSYDLDFGDSIGGAGLMFNLLGCEDSSSNLKGFLLSFNFLDPYDSCGRGNVFYKTGKTASIWYFEYKKGVILSSPGNNYLEIPEVFKHITDIDIPKNGKIIMKIDNSSQKYNIYYKSNSSSAEQLKYSLNVSSNPYGLTFNPEAFGFFSSHFAHGCAGIGKFELKNIRIKYRKLY